MVCGKTEKKKMRSCVEDVKDQGKSEDSAYAICTESVKKAYNTWILKNSNDFLIVARHPGVSKWLESQGIVGDSVEHVDNPEQVRNKNVVGVIPFYLAAEANEVYSIDIPDLPREMRGKDLTPEEMDKYGATLTRYKVTKL